MKKLFIVSLTLLLVSSVAFAADFAPTLLKLSAQNTIHYDFDGTDLEIPVTVTGTPAQLVFLVYTKDQGDAIGEVKNGFLGWHHVNRIDTCMYVSEVNNLDAGSNKVVWDGKDNDGNAVPGGEYTYYMWAFDNVSQKTLATMVVKMMQTEVRFQEMNENGEPLANPIMYSVYDRWILGSDPQDETLLETTSITFPEDWPSYMTGRGPQLDPIDFSVFYEEVGYETWQAIAKYKWVPNGESYLMTEWGDDGLARFTAPWNESPGVVTDGDYLYTGDNNHWGPGDDQADADFVVVSFDGDVIAEIDMTQWWSSLEDQDAGGQVNGGPNTMNMRNGKIIMNCHCSCIKQLIDPQRFLETDDEDMLYAWTNTNGDYIFDHNFEEDSERPWVCMDYSAAPFVWNMDMDSNLFAGGVTYDIGAVSFGLAGPDGTGIGYFSYAGETAERKFNISFLDYGSAYDGLYCDTYITDVSSWGGDGTWFIGQDSIKGVITSAVNVENAVPADFTVAQNSPNPFNPTTTINFTTSEAGNVAVDVYNVAGQKVDTIVSDFMSAGNHTLTWDASSFSAGVYFYTVKAGEFSRTMKMTLLK